MQVLALKCDIVPVTCCTGTWIHQEPFFLMLGSAYILTLVEGSGWVSRDDQTTNVYEIAEHIGAASFCASSVGGAGGMGEGWGRGGS